MSIVDYSEFDASTIKFGAARKNKSGGTAIYLSDAEGQRVRLQFPFLRCPFGLGEYTDKDTKKVSYSIDLALDEGSAEVDALKKILEKLDDVIIQAAVKNQVRSLRAPF